MRSRPIRTVWITAFGLLLATEAHAQFVPPAAFEMVGFVQEATLDGTVAGTAAVSLPNTDPRAGGTVTVNGIKLLVPNHTLVQMPAFALSWAQLFNPDFSSPVLSSNTANLATGTETGLALADNSSPFPSFEVRAVGNITRDPVSGAPRYMVGGLMVPVSQQSLNAGFGVVNFIDHATGRIRVGGIPNDANCINGLPNCSGTLLEINDPIGRHGLPHSPDPRFTADTNNPTISTITGYPVCVPRFAPPTVDVDCPVTNRPLNPRAGVNTPFPHDPFLAVGAPMRTFTMPAVPISGGLDATKQVPLSVGDEVNFSGTLYRLEPSDPNHNPALPVTSPANMYVSVHTLVANMGVYTAPGVRPCYVRVEEIVMPTGQVRNQPLVTSGNPITAIPLVNPTDVLITGFTTDPSRLIDIMAIDVHPVSGAETERKIATVLPEGTGPTLVRGRFVFEAGRAAAAFPATREYIAKSRTGQMVSANGLTTGQYRLPCFEYHFAERTVPGNPMVPHHFNLMPFLASGSGPIGGFGSGTPVIGRLDPWPGP
ncbi:MAG: hypothetical protein AB9873_18530 [Syntrophobacteraceae bacterium]